MHIKVFKCGTQSRVWPWRQCVWCLFGCNVNTIMASPAVLDHNFKQYQGLWHDLDLKPLTYTKIQIKQNYADGLWTRLSANLASKKYTFSPGLIGIPLLLQFWFEGGSIDSWGTCVDEVPDMLLLTYMYQNQIFHIP